MSTSINFSEIINLAVGIASFIFGIVALVLSVVFYIEAKKAEKNTAVTLEGISKTTTTLDRLSMRMINKLTSAIIEPSQREETLRALLMAAPSGGGLNPTSNESPSRPSRDDLEQFRVDNLIAAYYYCGLTNISSRYHLPETIVETNEFDEIVKVVDGSASDFAVIRNWLDITEKIDEKINKSPVKSMYDRTIPMVGEVFDTREHYARRERESLSMRPT